MTARQWLETYYLSTPLFWLIDDFCGISVRAAVFDGHPSIKKVYYLYCLACGWAIRMKRLPFWVSAVESCMNLIFLFVAFVVPYFLFVGQFDPEHPASNPVTISRVINFVLSGTVAIVSFHRVVAPLSPTLE